MSVLIAAFNAGMAYYFIKTRNRGQALAWILVAGVFLLHALAYLSPAGHGLVIPEGATALRIFRASGAHEIPDNSPGLTPGATLCRRSAARLNRA